MIYLLFLLVPLAMFLIWNWGQLRYYRGKLDGMDELKEAFDELEMMSRTRIDELLDILNEKENNHHGN